MLHVDQRFAKLLREFAMRRKIDFIVLEYQFVDKGLQKIVNVIAAEIVDSDFAALPLVQAVSERSRGRFVDEAEDFETGDFAGILGGLALGIIEIRGDGDDGAADGFAEMRFRPIL